MLAEQRRRFEVFMACLVLLLMAWSGWSQAATITVNSTDNTDTRDAVLGLTEAILVSNGTLAVGSLNPGEAAQVVGTPGASDIIGFNIPGPGPHVIAVPDIGVGFSGGAGLPGLTSNGTLVDGYSQPGSAPNTNGILQPNNAVIQIIISAVGLVTAVEYYMFSIVGNDCVLRGISFLGDQFTSGADNFGVTFHDPSTGGACQGCWIGVHPDGVTVSGQELGIEACCGTSGHIWGTNGDGVNDENEFNVICGHNVNTLIEDGHDVRISGNFIGILPDGMTAADNGSIGIGEGDASEGGDLDGLLIGTNSDGVGDANERNIIGGMADDVLQHYYDDNPGVVVAGNYIGVGIDGVTAIPNTDFVEDQGDPYESIRIGSNLDGVRDDTEANIVANTVDRFMRFDNDGTFNEAARISYRGNSSSGNTMNYVDLDNSAFARFLGTGDPATLTPTLAATTNATRIVGTVPVTATHVDINSLEVDLYISDGSGIPQGETYLGTFVEGSGTDLDPSDGGFEFNITGLVPVGAHPLTVTANAIETLGVSTSKFSNFVYVFNSSSSASVEEWHLYR